MLARMQIQHKIDQCPLQPRASSLVKSEPSSREFCRAAEIQDVQFFTNLPVIFGRKIKLCRLTPAANFSVVVRTLAHLDVWIGKVGEGQHESFKTYFNFCQRPLAVA